MAAVFKNIGGASAIPAHWAATPLLFRGRRNCILKTCINNKNKWHLFCSKHAKQLQVQKYDIVTAFVKVDSKKLSS